MEDDPNDVLLIERVFRRANIANPLRVISDGEHAVAYLSGDGEFADREAHPLPVLVLLDLKLPRKSGLEVLEWLNTQPELKHVPVSVLTSSNHTRDVSRAHELGIDSYIVKPLTLKSLQQLVRNLDLYWVLVSERRGVAG